MHLGILPGRREGITDHLVRMNGKKTKTDKKQKEKKDSLKEVRIAYRSLEDRKKFIRSVFIPSFFLG